MKNFFGIVAGGAFSGIAMATFGYFISHYGSDYSFFGDKAEILYAIVGAMIGIFLGAFSGALIAILDVNCLKAVLVSLTTHFVTGVVIMFFSSAFRGSAYSNLLLAHSDGNDRHS